MMMLGLLCLIQWLNSNSNLSCQWPRDEPRLSSVPLGALASFGDTRVLAAARAASDVLSGIVLELHHALAAVHARFAVDNLAVDAFCLRSLPLCRAVELADERRLSLVSHAARVRRNENVTMWALNGVWRNHAAAQAYHEPSSIHHTDAHMPHGYTRSMPQSAQSEGRGGGWLDCELVV